MERDRVTLFAGVPTMYFALLHHESPRAHDLSALKYCMAGGSAMPVEVMRAFEAKFPVQILEGYGLSETSPGRELQHARSPAQAGLDRLPRVGRRDVHPRRRTTRRWPTASPARSASAATTS